MSLSANPQQPLNSMFLAAAINSGQLPQEYLKFYEAVQTNRVLEPSDLVQICQNASLPVLGKLTEARSGTTTKPNHLSLLKIAGLGKDLYSEQLVRASSLLRSERPGSLVEFGSWLLMTDRREFESVMASLSDSLSPHKLIGPSDQQLDADFASTDGAKADLLDMLARHTNILLPLEVRFSICKDIAKTKHPVLLQHPIPSHRSTQEVESFIETLYQIRNSGCATAYAWQPLVGNSADNCDSPIGVSTIRAVAAAYLAFGDTVHVYAPVSSLGEKLADVCKNFGGTPVQTKLLDLGSPAFGKAVLEQVT